MASESNTSNIATNIAEEMQTVIIGDVRYEIPKAVADLLASSKSISDSNPKTTKNVEDRVESEKLDASVVAGEVSVGLKEAVGVDETGVVNPEGVIGSSTGVDTVEKKLDSLISESVEDVLKNPEGVNEGVLCTVKTGDVSVDGDLNVEQAVRVMEDCLESLQTSKKAEADSVKSGEVETAAVENPGGVDTVAVENQEKVGADAVENTEVDVAVTDIQGEEKIELKNPEGVVDSDNTEYLFAYSQEKEDTAKDAGEPSVGLEKSGVNQILDELVELGKIAKFKGTEGVKDVDCEMVETSSTVSTKKVKKPLPLRIQPVRDTGKRKLEVKEEAAPKSSVKRAKRSKSGKEILMEVECSERFLMDEGLTEVFELLKAQGWEKICETQEYVCPEVVEEFYRNLKLIDGTVPALEVKFKGHKFNLSSIELAMIMKLDHQGFDLFCKNNVWPKEAGDKQEFVRRICKLDRVPKGSGISTQLMEPSVKILHKLLVSNFIQRGVKPSYVQHQDLIVLDKLLKKERINLPKLIIHQMDHLKKLTQIGFSRVIKKVLQVHGLYQVTSEVEEQVVREFDPEVFRKMNLVKDQVEGWIKVPVQEPKLGAKPDLMDVEEEGDDEVEDDNAKLMAVFEQVVSDVKKELKEIRTELREFKEEIKEEIKEVKDALLALVEKL